MVSGKKVRNSQRRAGSVASTRADPTVGREESPGGRNRDERGTSASAQVSTAGVRSLLGGRKGRNLLVTARLVAESEPNALRKKTIQIIKHNVAYRKKAYNQARLCELLGIAEDSAAAMFVDEVAEARDVQEPHQLANLAQASAIVEQVHEETEEGGSNTTGSYNERNDETFNLGMRPLDVDKMTATKLRAVEGPLRDVDEMKEFFRNTKLWPMHTHETVGAQIRDFAREVRMCMGTPEQPRISLLLFRYPADASSSDPKEKQMGVYIESIFGPTAREFWKAARQVCLAFECDLQMESSGKYGNYLGFAAVSWALGAYFNAIRGTPSVEMSYRLTHAQAVSN